MILLVFFYSFLGVAKFENQIVACAVGYGVGGSEHKYVRSAVFTSSDSGETFQKDPYFGAYPCTDLITDPNIPSHFYIATFLGIFETKNAGEDCNPIINVYEFE